MPAVSRSFQAKGGVPADGRVAASSIAKRVV